MEFLLLKKNQNPPSKMFEGEARGLKKLSESGLPVPEVYVYTEDYLLMEYLPPGPPQPSKAGRELAKLHCQQQTTYFGLDYDNYIGRLPQKNESDNHWVEFFWKNRIQYPLELLMDRGVGEDDLTVWEALKGRLSGLIPPCEPTLIHGDLWSGNLYWSTHGPYFIDPAIHYADPMVELAFTELFGSFGKKFYEAYSEASPLPKEYKGLKRLYHIYPLLVHANLFGGGYYTSALRNAKIYL